MQNRTHRQTIDFSFDSFIRDSTKEIAEKEKRREYYTTALNAHLITNKISLNPNIHETFIVDFNGKVIASTDEMSSRKIIYEYCKQSGVRLFVDARMGGEVMRIYSISPSLPQEQKFYEASLYEDKEVNGEKCTAKTIIYNVLLIASLITSQIKKDLTQEDIMNEIIFDFKTLIFNSRKA